MGMRGGRPRSEDEHSQRQRDEADGSAHDAQKLGFSVTTMRQPQSGQTTISWASAAFLPLAISPSSTMRASWINWACPAPPAPQERRSYQPQRTQAGGKACSWPVGDPKQPGFHFCGEPAEPGRPYCGTHCQQAYQRKSEAA